MVKKDDDLLSRSDLENIFEVNKKAIEIQVEVASQNEKIIEELEESKEISENIKKETESTLKEISTLKQDVKQDFKDIKKDILDKIETVKTKVEELDKSQFKIYVLLTSGAIAIILQIIQLFLNLKK